MSNTAARPTGTNPDPALTHDVHDGMTEAEIDAMLDACEAHIAAHARVRPHGSRDSLDGLQAEATWGVLELSWQG